MKRRVAILISGRGSNMAALIEAAKAHGFSGRNRRRDFQPRRRRRARHAPGPAALPTAVIESKPFGKDRAAFEARVQSALDEHRVELICLGGFMRLFTAEFVQRWYGRMLNIHPSLLPSFPGLDPHGQALRAGVKISGATVHFVIPETDAGPIVMQGAVAGPRRRHAGDAGRSGSSRSSIASIPKRCGCSRAARSGSRAIFARRRAAPAVGRTPDLAGGALKHRRPRFACTNKIPRQSRGHRHDLLRGS